MAKHHQNDDPDFAFTCDDLVEPGEDMKAEEYSATRVMMTDAVAKFILPVGEMAKEAVGNPQIRQLLLTYLLSKQSMSSLMMSYMISKLS